MLGVEEKIPLLSEKEILSITKNGISILIAIAPIIIYPKVIFNDFTDMILL